MFREPVVIDVTPPGRQLPALRLVFANLPADEQLANLNATVAAAEAGRVSLANLLEARRGVRLVGVAWGYSLPGRQAVVWPARLVEDELESTAAALHERLEAALAIDQSRILQALLPERNGPDAVRLIAAGFQHVADLAYLVCEAEKFPNEPPLVNVAFECVDECATPRLAHIVEETYRDTLDCPWLNGLRDTHDVLAGYRHTGQFLPNRWLIARHADRDIGCLLLTDHPDDDQWELVYMGIVPAARGCGFGSQITRHAQWLTRQSGRQRLILAVDAANEPAVAMYSAAGFQLWSLTSAFAKPISRPLE